MIEYNNDPLLIWRDDFPILQETTYLVSHSLGAMPRGVYHSLRDYAHTWGTRGVLAWNEEWFELNGEVGDKIGAIMGAPNGTVTIHQNASIAISILLSAMDWSNTIRHKVIVTDMIFHTDYYVLREMLPSHVDLVVIKSRDGITIDTDELLAAIDDRTRFVCLGHVLFRSSYIMPVQAVVEKAHRAGAQVLLDGYHSVGVIPVDVTELNVDYYVGGVLKWMCGGPGGVFLYVRPDLLKTLRPKITGWFAHKRPFEFEIDRIDLRDDAYRLLNGTFGVASLYSIQPGIDTIAAIGVDAIREKSVRMTSLLYELAEKEGYTVNSPADPDVRGGMVVVDPPNAYEVSRELLARNFLIDYRVNAGIRIAPHFYNTETEVRAVMLNIEDILASGDWQKHSGPRSFIT